MRSVRFCLFLGALLFSLSLFALPSQAQNSLPVHCGNPIALNVNIANQQIKKYKYGIPFVAGSTGSVKNVFWWARHDNERPGYSGGTGGTIQIGIYTDESGKPGNLIGQSVNHSFDLQNAPPSWFTTTNLSRAGVQVVEGNKYWVVFKNVDPEADTNFVSLNGPFLRNSPRSFGGPIALDHQYDLLREEGNANDLRAFGTARPKDNLYLHYTKTNDDNAIWRPYREDNSPSFVSFPYCVVRVDDGDGLKSYGFRFAYGPTHCIRRDLPDDDVYKRMPQANGSNRIMQIAKFRESTNFPISNAKLYVFARSLDTNETSKLAVMVNGVLQDCIEVNRLAWYSIDLDFNVEADVEYKIEFLAANSDNVLVMCAPIAGGGETGLDYTGGARLSTDSGLTWKGFPFGHRPAYSNVQLSFYIEGEAELKLEK